MRETWIRLPARGASVAAARGFVHDTCAGTAAAPLCDDAQLVVSELVTNAVHATCAAFTLALAADGCCLGIAVRDDASALPALQASGGEADSGRGLQLVAALADAWGTRALAQGKVVWARISRDGGAG